VSSQSLTLTLDDDGGYSYLPTQTINSGGTTPANEQLPIIASTYKGEDKKYVTTAGARARVGTANTENVTITGAVKTLTGGTLNALGSTYDLLLSDGTHVPITQTSATGAATLTYSATVERFEVYATIDGNKVGHDPDTDGDVDFTQQSDGSEYTQQMSIGTMAFLGGKNIDTLQLGSDGTPENDASTSLYINALSSSDANGYGRTDDNGIMQFTITSDDMSALTAPSQTYANSQDGHSVSNLSSYAIDSDGKLIATYDNGETFVKGQLILAQFYNLDGLMPNGSNTFTATDASGEPILSAPGSGLLGQVRSKALEASNVDLTSQLVQLMVLQRQYSATSQALKLQASTLIDDAINMGR
jgi:flagellar hook-basal body protein